MPALPEVGDVRGAVRRPEICGQPDSQQQRGTDRDIRIAGEIVIQLKCVRIDRDQNIPAGIKRRKVEYAVHQIVTEVVGNQELLTQTQTYEE